ncbi:MAG: alpha/beta fold hydrolase, partial [Bacteroidia bacterium]|nr:alpha/beta fold hydrolase [Bacteroidia bacterium]
MLKIKTTRKFPSAIRWILWVLLVQLILINISASLYAYKFTHFYTDPALRIYHPARNVFAKTWKLFTGPKQPRSVITEIPVFPFDTVVLKTASGSPIDVWYSETDSVAKGTIIFFHGITVSKSMMVHPANELRYLGYNVMLVDFRGHGNSGGNKTTIGIKESEEVKLAYDYAVNKGDKNIFLFGSSLGAVVVAKAIADYHLRVSGIILDMPFLSLQTYMEGKARRVGFPQQPFAFLTTLWTGLENGFNGFHHQTTRYVKQITCPVLMEWGALDDFVLKEETAEIYKAIASS